MRNYEERAVDFIKAIFPFIRVFDSPFCIRHDVDEFNMSRSRNVIVRYGSARIALITSDYVVKWDYDEEEVSSIGGCENEVELYAEAQVEGFAYLLAKITRVEYKGHFFYIMPRVHGIDDENGYAWQYMSDEEKNWCAKHSLTDLHCCNYGLNDGKVTIIDYAYQENKVDSSSSYNYYDSEKEVSES